MDRRAITDRLDFAIQLIQKPEASRTHYSTKIT